MSTRIHHFINISELSKDILRSYLPSDATFYSLSNPTDLPFSKPVKVADNRAFLAVGRLAKEKGVHLFAQAAMQLGIEAVFVGDGDCRQNLRAIYPQAKVTGWLPREGVAQYLRMARVLVLPSLCYEASPLVVKEAASMGIPAIVSDTCAGANDIIDGVTGLRFQHGNIVNLMEKIKIFQKNNIVEKYGRAAYEHYWKNPQTIQRYTVKLKRIYNEIWNSDVM